MSYTHITLDVGAAIKAFPMIWNKPDEWSDILIHCWLVHVVFSEALERLFIVQYSPTIPKTVKEFLLNESDEVTATHKVMVLSKITSRNIKYRNLNA